MYAHASWKKTFLPLLFLQAFKTEEILKHHIKDCFKINNKEMIKMPKKGEYVKLKNVERRTKRPFMILVTDKKDVMVKEDNYDFENSTKCWICDNAYVDGDAN